jgi:hypothetical protein
MDSRYFGIMEGHGNFALNLVGYIFLSLGLQTASMSSALLSVILVCNRKNKSLPPIMPKQREW